MSPLRPIVMAFSLALVATPAAHAGAPTDELVAEALGANPGLEALEARATALRERAAAAGAWPDPEVHLEYMGAPVTTFWIGDHMMGSFMVKAQAMLPPPGMSRAARTAGDRMADEATLATREAELALRVEVERTWWSLVRTRIGARITADHLARTRELLDSARARYTTGTGGQAGVLRLEQLRSELEDMLREEERMDVELVAMLGAALARPTPGEFPTPDVVDPAPPPATRDWLAVARAHSPMAARMAAMRDTAAAEATMARVMGRPEVMVWAGYQMRVVDMPDDPGTDLVSAGVGVPLPLGSGRRARAEVSAQEALGRAADADLAGWEDMARARITSVLTGWQRGAERTERWRSELLPTARAALDATLAEWRVDRAMVMDVYEAEVMLLDLERQEMTAVTDTWIARAELTGVLGVPPDEEGAP